VLIAEALGHKLCFAGSKSCDETDFERGGGGGGGLPVAGSTGCCLSVTLGSNNCDAAAPATVIDIRIYPSEKRELFHAAKC
jgi:hypothetical protein